MRIPIIIMMIIIIMTIIAFRNVIFLFKPLLYFLTEHISFRSAKKLFENSCLLFVQTEQKQGLNNSSPKVLSVSVSCEPRRCWWNIIHLTILETQTSLLMLKRDFHVTPQWFPIMIYKVYSQYWKPGITLIIRVS